MLLNSSDFVQLISPEKRDVFIERARQSNTTAITFQDFVNIVSVHIYLLRTIQKLELQFIKKKIPIISKHKMCGY